MSTLQARYQHIQSRIQQAAEQYHVAAPQLLAVSKKHSADSIRTLYETGQRAFGESYWQEAEGKLLALQDLNIEWHFIGPLQSNKTRPIAEHFDWVHSVDRFKLAQRLSSQRPEGMPALNLCIQVNIDSEDSKSGVTEAEARILAAQIIELPNVQLRGLMCIPSAKTCPQEQQTSFFNLRKLRDHINQSLSISLDTLSMGMSDDLESAIAEHSSIVRVGSALFGARGETQ